MEISICGKRIKLYVLDADEVVNKIDASPDLKDLTF